MRRKKDQPRAQDRRGSEESRKTGLEPNAAQLPTVDPAVEIKAELHRWHLGRVLVHQFSLMARRAAPPSEPEDRRGNGGRDDGRGDGRLWWQRYRWQRVRPVKISETGLAAMKHAQHQQQRAAMMRHFHEAEAKADRRQLAPDSQKRQAFSGSDCSRQAAGPKAFIR